MSNNPKLEPARFYVEESANGYYAVCDRANDERRVKGIFTTSAEAIEHAKKLNEVFKGSK